MSLLEQLDAPETYTLEDGYRVLIESHVPYLRTSKNTSTVTAEAQYGEKFIGDFYGLLDYLSIDKKYRYLVLRMNDLASSDAYDGVRLTFLVPSPTEANAFLDVYTSIES